MQRFALRLITTSACFFAFAVAVVLPGHVMAFEMEPGAVTVPGGSTQFQDPDEKSLTAPPTPLKLEDDGSTSMALGTDPQSAPGTGLQLAPGMGLQITGGSGPLTPGLQLGFQMAPTFDHSNPADDKSLIPTP